MLRVYTCLRNAVVCVMCEGLLSNRDLLPVTMRIRTFSRVLARKMGTTVTS